MKIDFYERKDDRLIYIDELEVEDRAVKDYLELVESYGFMDESNKRRFTHANTFSSKRGFLIILESEDE